MRQLLYQQKRQLQLLVRTQRIGKDIDHWQYIIHLVH